MDDRELKKRFRKELTLAAGPVVPAVRSAIAAIPVTGTGGSTGLRGRLQKATRLQVRTVGRQAGVRVLVDPKRMPDGQKSLPALMEGLRPWRKPVFGNRDVWVTQPFHRYFFPTVRVLGIRGRIAMAKVVSGITRDIT
jgi:hypothetical protein